ncbi:MAG: hypothetical protein E7363_04270 [Clostridiales bacterium]|nr:hypothetical protein [Clostridiales bacterium]
MKQSKNEMGIIEKLQGFFLAFCMVGIFSCLLLLLFGTIVFENQSLNLIEIAKVIEEGKDFLVSFWKGNIMFSLGTFLKVLVLIALSICNIVLICVTAVRLVLLIIANIKTMQSNSNQIEIRDSLKHNLTTFNSILFKFMLLITAWLMFGEAHIKAIPLTIIICIVFFNCVVNALELYCRKGMFKDCVIISTARAVLLCAIPVYVKKASNIDIASFFSIFNTWDFWKYLIEGWSTEWVLLLLFKHIFLPLMQILLLVPFITLYVENINNEYFRYEEKVEGMNKRIKKLIILWCVYFTISIIALFCFSQVSGFVHFLKYLGVFLCPAVLICAEYFAVMCIKVNNPDIYLLKNE